MQPNNLFSLLADRLLIHANAFTMATYNVLFEILVERVSGPMVERRSTEITAEWKIENPGKTMKINGNERNFLFFSDDQSYRDFTSKFDGQFESLRYKISFS